MIAIEKELVGEREEGIVGDEEITQAIHKAISGICCRDNVF